MYLVDIKMSEHIHKIGHVIFWGPDHLLSSLYESYQKIENGIKIFAIMTETERNFF